MNDPIISIDRQFKSIGLFDGFALVRPFHPFKDEAEAEEEARNWFRARSKVVPKVIYPRLTNLKQTYARSSKKS